MILDKYGTGPDPYCDPQSGVLRNRLGLQDEAALAAAERALSSIAASRIEFAPPPYDLHALQALHRQLFGDVYDWAGELRTVDISKSGTRFCHVSRIAVEAAKIFGALAGKNWLEGLARPALVRECAVAYGDLNMVHPFREGNGRALRLLFEQIVINAGHAIDWWQVRPEAWLQANVDAVVCDYERMEAVFDRCIGAPLSE
ncbi:Fic/DOC family protein [Xenophilus azovorans]|uniref:Fic/DOC family protein n=1 Tax=Xenophilus azovorans TaxID=151755 RepID=UPI000AD617BA|nr:Fic family protein [Xenophilus azovorans]